MLIHCILILHYQWCMLMQEAGLFENTFGDNTSFSALIPTKYHHQLIKCDTKAAEIINCEQQTKPNKSTTTQTNINNRSYGTTNSSPTSNFNPLSNNNSNSSSSPDFTILGDTVLPKITPVIPHNHTTLINNPGQQPQSNNSPTPTETHNNNQHENLSSPIRPTTIPII